MANIAKLLVSLGVDASDYQSGLDKATASTTGFVDKLNGSVAPMIAGAFAAGGAAAVAFAATSINAAGDFEAGMLEFASVTGSSITDAGLTLDQFQSKFLELGATTAFSAAQAQQAAIELAKGGVPIIDIMNGATDATLSLAAAGGVELANAATIVSKQLGVWASEGVTAANVADLMAQAANASTVDVEELAMGMANVGGIAKVAGVSFAETTTTLAMISSGFSSASDAGTSLKTFLARLQPTTDSATKAMIDLGLATADGTSKFYDANGSFIGMAAAAELLQNSTSGLSEAEKTMALQTIFGSDALRAAALIAENGAEGFQKTTDAMNSAGTAAEQAAMRNQGFKFALDSLFGSIETLQIIVGGALLPAITAFINDGLIPAVNGVTEFATAIMSADDPIFAVTNALYAISPILGDLVGYFLVATIEGDKFNDFFANLPAPIQAAIGILETIAGVIGNNLQPILIAVAAVLGGIVVSAIFSMIAAFMAIAAPIAAAIAVAAAMYAAYQSNFFGIRDAVTSVMNAVQAVITSVATFIQGFWAAHGAVITATAIETWNMIMTTITTVVGGISTIITTVFTAVAAFINRNGAEIGNFFRAAWDLITGIIQAALNVIQGIVKVFIGIFTGDWKTFAAGAAQITQGLIDALYTIFKSGGALLQSAINVALELVRSVLLNFTGDAKGLGANIINGIVNGVKSGVGALVGAVRDAAMKALDAAKSALGIKSPSRVAAAEIGIPFVQGIETGIDGMLGSLGRTAGAAAGVLADAVNTSAPAWAPADVTGEAASLYNTPSGPQYNITAQYAKYQDERTLRDDIRMYSLLNAPNAG